MTNLDTTALDRTARRAGTAARDAADPTLDVADVHRASRRRTARNVAGGATAVVAVLAIGAAVLPTSTPDLEISDVVGNDQSLEDAVGDPALLDRLDGLDPVLREQLADLDTDEQRSARLDLRDAHLATVACARAAVDQVPNPPELADVGVFDRTSSGYLTVELRSAGPIRDRAALESRIADCRDLFETEAEERYQALVDVEAGAPSVEDARACLEDAGASGSPDDEVARAECRDIVLAEEGGFATPTSDAREVVADGVVTRQEQRAVHARWVLCLEDVDAAYPDVQVTAGGGAIFVFDPLYGAYERSHVLGPRSAVLAADERALQAEIDTCNAPPARLDTFMRQQFDDVALRLDANEPLTDVLEDVRARRQRVADDLRACAVEGGVDVPSAATTVEDVERLFVADGTGPNLDLLTDCTERLAEVP